MENKIFRQIRNDARDIEAVADGYRTKIDNEFWLAGGLQKDAIQNSWDARFDKESGKDWECGLSSLDISGKNYLCICDQGTTGLNGTKFYNEVELVEILNSNKQGEDLAYFLNSNWSAKSSEEGGNRGRGKTLFLAASNDKKIYFDSLRSSDKTYIFGELFLDIDKQVKFILHYGEEAENQIKRVFNGKLFPKEKFGTRVFVLNPDAKILEAMATGEMISLISNSRWETIKKFNARIFVDDGKEIKYANFPHWYEEELEEVKTKEFPTEIIKEDTEYKIKRLVLRYAPNLNLPEDIKGIAIQRGGMTIQYVQPEELVHEEGMRDIYGWLEMKNKPLEEEMKKLCEGPEHFDFTWTVRPAKYLRDFIRMKIRSFANELKIIESEQVKKNKIQKTAEEEAVKSLAPLFRKLGLSGKRKGNRIRKKAKRKENEPLRLSVSDIKFPKEGRRVNYGDRINSTYVVPINELKESIRVFVRVFISSEEGKTELLEEKEINLQPGRGAKIGPDFLDITSDYIKGGYSLRARMVYMEDGKRILPDGTEIEKGSILYDRVNQKFYVEIDPPETGPFEFQAKDRNDKTYLFEWELAEDGGYVIYYNSLHPRIKILGGDFEKLKDYLIEQASLIAFQIKLEELTADNDKSDEEFTRLIKSKDTSSVLRFFMKRYSSFLWELRK